MVRQASPARLPGCLGSAFSGKIILALLREKRKTSTWRRVPQAMRGAWAFVASFGISESLDGTANEAARVLASEPAQGERLGTSFLCAPGTIDYTVQITCDANSGAGLRIGGSKG